MATRAMGWVALLFVLVAPGGGARLQVHLLARHVAVGQAFPIYVRPAGNAEAVGGPVEVSIIAESGRTIWHRAASRAGNEWSVVAALAAPGGYRILARGGADGGERAAVKITAVAPPPPYYGGVLAVGQFGLPDALQEALRAHGFALQPGLSEGAPRVLAIADPSLGRQQVSRQYQAIWSAVAAGSNLVLLSPPAADMQRYWPFAARLVPYRAACGTAWNQGSTPLVEGLPAAAEEVLRPELAYDLSQTDAIEIESLPQRLLLRAGVGYSGCYAWFRFRYGQGLVTVSTVPVLERASDAYVRRYLMNLLKVAGAAPRGAPKPGLAAAFARRLASTGE